MKNQTTVFGKFQANQMSKQESAKVSGGIVDLLTLCKDWGNCKPK